MATGTHAAWEALRLSGVAQLDETHTSLAALPLFRSPNADRSWVTASGAVLDAAALYLACIDHPPQPAANLCIRAGYTTRVGLLRLAGQLRPDVAVAGRRPRRALRPVERRPVTPVRAATDVAHTPTSVTTPWDRSGHRRLASGSPPS